MIDAALAEMGWRRRDVDLIINSHLHYDHSENNLAFPQAQFFVSRTEWDFAHDPNHAPGPALRSGVDRPRPDLSTTTR